jgi:hypothetical protein
LIYIFFYFHETSRTPPEKFIKFQSHNGPDSNFPEISFYFRGEEREQFGNETDFPLYNALIKRKAVVTFDQIKLYFKAFTERGDTERKGSMLLNKLVAALGDHGRKKREKESISREWRACIGEAGCLL